MKQKRIRRFLELILTTEDEELDCAGLMQVIDRYVEVDARGDDPTAVHSGVPHHLHQCADCAELYNTLLNLVQLEETGEIPEIDALWAELRATVSGPA